jgi:hypothetical protein
LGPASPRWKVVHANDEHSAVLQACHAAAQGDAPAATVVAKTR